MPTVSRALISVFDKAGVVAFARGLADLSVELISTGGTAKFLRENGLQVRSISDLTAFPEILSGRVKTMHPRIYGGLLALRDNPEHQQQMKEHGIEPIDMVVVNLYPFEQTIARAGVELAEALENIDIGGPCMIRAAAKNFGDVVIVTSPDQYATVLAELKQNGDIAVENRKKLAARAFLMTSGYDSAIQAYLSEKSAKGPLEDHVEISLAKVQSLRYGENPHQQAALYRARGVADSGLLKAKQLHGKALSYNNLMDADAAVGIVQEFTEPCVAIVKHMNPCGVATGSELHLAYEKANATDPVSAFGGIVAVNREMDVETATALAKVFTEVIIAPGFAPEALEVLQEKKNLRLLEMPEIAGHRPREFEVKRVQGGFLVQDQDFLNINDIDFKVVTKRQPDEREWRALKFGWRVCKWVKSNAIVYCESDHTIGIGAGQMSRVDSARLAADKAVRAGLKTEGAVLASDAFFPFRDGVDVAAQAGATAVIQPGGSVRDEEVIAAANEHGLAMVFTGIRHFRH